MTIEIDAGESIYRAAQKACETAKSYWCEVHFRFNGIIITVSQFSFDEDIVRIYYHMREIEQLKEKLKW